MSLGQLIHFHMDCRENGCTLLCRNCNKKKILESSCQRISSTKHEKSDNSDILFYWVTSISSQANMGKPDLQSWEKNPETFSIRGCEVLTLTWESVLKPNSTCPNKHGMLTRALVHTADKYYTHVTDFSLVHLLKQG